MPALMLLAITSCATPSPPAAPALSQAGFRALPGWEEDAVSGLLPALAAQCRLLAELPPDTALGGEGVSRAYAGSPGDWAAPCGALPPEASDAEARRFLERWFQPYRVETPALLTGYFEPSLRGSLTASGAFNVAVLSRPGDLVVQPQAAGAPRIGRLSGGTLVPYWSRGDIEAGYAPARPILYLQSPIDLFFLQVQGSGRVQLSDGSTVRLAFAGSNGRPYMPLGRVLVAMRALAPEAVTMQSIAAWLAAHPEQAKPVMDRNEHYVFFRVAAEGAAGPAGTLGLALTPGRSAAVDRQAVPLGVPLYIDTRDPVSGHGWRHLVLAQDTGADLHGAARADVFLGAGDAASRMAGAMHEAGTVYVLLPRPAGSRVAKIEQSLSLPR